MGVTSLVLVPLALCLKPVVYASFLRVAPGDLKGDARFEFGALLHEAITMKPGTLFFGLTLICLSIPNPWLSQSRGAEGLNSPLDMETLKEALSHVRGGTRADEGWPRVIEYEHEHYDFRKDAFHSEEKTFTIRSRPLRIIPHAVGVSEILWAICPRERIIAFNELSANPDISFIADHVKKSFPVLNSKQTEVVIGYQPDLIFTVFYSDADFKEKLEQARIPFFDLGYFGTIESIRKQILLIGEVVGEEANAGALVSVIDEKIQALKKRIPKMAPPGILEMMMGKTWNMSPVSTSKSCLNCSGVSCSVSKRVGKMMIPASMAIKTVEKHTQPAEETRFSRLGM